jgi:hypothetical protein
MNAEKKETMKKNALFLMILLMPLFMLAQQDAPTIPLDDAGKIRYAEVVNEPGSQSDLFERSITWINKEYKNPFSATTTRDFNGGKIIIEQVFQVNTVSDSGTIINSDVKYKMTIRFKEGRYRVEMTGFSLKKAPRTKAEEWMNKSSEYYNPKYLKQLDDFARGKIESFIDGMKPPKKYKEEDW